MDNGTYSEINQTHKRLLHSGWDKTFEAIQRECYGINRAEITWFVNHCKRCIQNHIQSTLGPLQPIQSTEVNERVQLDLIDMCHQPAGIYNWILHTHNHKARYMTLWALVDKTALEVAQVMSF